MFATSLANGPRRRPRRRLGVDRNGACARCGCNEEYVLYDLNGDGIAERLCVHRVGNTVLAIEEVDYQPFEYWTPYPMQGRLIGQSLADKTMDIQRVNTVLERSDAGQPLSQQLAPGPTSTRTAATTRSTIC
jgi:hypothetical protein